MKKAKHGNRLDSFSQTHFISKYDISVVSPPVSPTNQFDKENVFIMLYIYVYT